MAHTKQKGSSKNARESASQRLGVRLGSDDTIYAVKKGKINFKTKKITKFDGSKRIVNIVNIV